MYLSIGQKKKKEFCFLFFIFMLGAVNAQKITFYDCTIESMKY